MVGLQIQYPTNSRQNPNLGNHMIGQFLHFFLNDFVNIKSINWLD